ncbi:MAG TPA: hypothetical protein VHT05_11335 [Candidatus Elarobacter sp.]|nr:hypothetical protein [Candidatus Elarobacter sp.]
MIPTQWPGLGPAVDLSSLDGGGTPHAAYGAAGDPWSPPATPDAVARPWWSCGTGAGNGNAFGAGNDSLWSSGAGGNGSSGNSISGLLTSIMNALQQFASTLSGGGAQSLSGGTQSFSGGGAQSPAQSGCQPPGSQWSQPWQQPPWQQPPGQQQPWQPWQGSPGASVGQEQTFSDVGISSSGDPHLTEVGTREGPAGNQPVDAHWDSMTSHPDLLHSDQIAGGYRVSTAVGAPTSSGTTFNQSATVHTTFGRDSVTLNRDGSFAVDDDGKAVTLTKGQQSTLSGGATVMLNDDGSLTVTARNAHGGSIETLMRSTGQAVDVDAHGHEIALGGDAITHHS